MRAGRSTRRKPRRSGWHSPRAAQLRGPARRTDHRRNLQSLAQHHALRVDQEGGECGKHVLCEKPLCPTVPRRSSLSTSAEEGVVLMDGFMWPHHPRTARLRQFLDQERSAASARGRLITSAWIRSIRATSVFSLPWPAAASWMWDVIRVRHSLGLRRRAGEGPGDGPLRIRR